MIKFSFKQRLSVVERLSLPYHSVSASADLRKPWLIFNKQNYLQKRVVSGSFKLWGCGISISSAPSEPLGCIARILSCVKLLYLISYVSKVCPASIVFPVPKAFQNSCSLLSRDSGVKFLESLTSNQSLFMEPTHLPLCTMDSKSQSEANFFVVSNRQHSLRLKFTIPLHLLAFLRNQTSQKSIA